jgi:hypothetical protein
VTIRLSKAFDATVFCKGGASDGYDVGVSFGATPSPLVERVTETEFRATSPVLEDALSRKSNLKEVRVFFTPKGGSRKRRIVSAVSPSALNRLIFEYEVPRVLKHEYNYIFGKGDEDTDPFASDSGGEFVSSPEQDDTTMSEEGCMVCQLNNEDEALICDGCDKYVHTKCAGLDEVPAGEWFCHTCKPPGRDRVEALLVNEERQFCLCRKCVVVAEGMNPSESQYPRHFFPPPHYPRLPSFLLSFVYTFSSFPSFLR